MEISRIEAYTKPQARTITTEWHPTYRLPIRIAEPNTITTSTYDASGNLLTKSIQATTDTNGSLGFAVTPAGTPRVWNYTYNNFGQVLTVDGPRTDVADSVSYSYDAQGNLSTLTNALNQTTRFLSYDAHGHPLSIQDPNGLVTQLSYDVRGRLTQRTVGTLTTTFTYDGVGQLIQITYPDGSTQSNTYDAAHRLTQVADSFGNRIIYTLDALGHPIREEVVDNGGPSNIVIPTTQTPGVATTTALLSASPSVVPAGQALSLTAYVLSNNGVTPPTGTVTFKEGATVLGTGQLAGGSGNTAIYVLSLASLSDGTHQFRVEYSGDAANAPSISAPVTVQTRQAATIAIGSGSGPNPALPGQPVTLNAVIAGVVNGIAPTGTITFRDGAQALGTVAVGYNAAQSGYGASFTTATLTSGTHPVVAVYSGDAVYSESISDVWNAVVSSISTTTTFDLSTGPNPAIVARPVTITAVIVGGTGSAAPTGTVTFKDGTTTLGTGTVSYSATLDKYVASYTISTLTVGAHSITAVYGGDANNLTSTSSAWSLTINNKVTTTTAMDVSTAPNPAVVGRPVTLWAAVSNGSAGFAPTGTVTFKKGTTTLGTGTLSYNATLGKYMASYTTTALTVGTNSITAVYAGDASDNTSTSTALSVVISRKVATTTAMDASSGPNPATLGQPVTLKAVVGNGATGAYAFGPSGTVTFKAGKTILGTGTLSYNVAAGKSYATFTTSTLKVGTHSITAAYGGDVSDNTSTSTRWSLTVK